MLLATDHRSSRGNVVDTLAATTTTTRRACLSASRSSTYRPSIHPEDPTSSTAPSTTATTTTTRKDQSVALLSHTKYRTPLGVVNPKRGLRSLLIRSWTTGTPEARSTLWAIRATSRELLRWIAPQIISMPKTGITARHPLLERRLAHCYLA